MSMRVDVPPADPVAIPPKAERSTVFVTVPVLSRSG